MIHQVPATENDARSMYGGSVVGSRDVRVASVVEVLEDRKGGRVGRWAAYYESADGSLQDAS